MRDPYDPKYLRGYLLAANLMISLLFMLVLWSSSGKSMSPEVALAGIIAVAGQWLIHLRYVQAKETKERAQARPLQTPLPKNPPKSQIPVNHTAVRVTKHFELEDDLAVDENDIDYNQADIGDDGEIVYRSKR
jgi:hypothetical protein